MLKFSNLEAQHSTLITVYYIKGFSFSLNR